MTVPFHEQLLTIVHRLQGTPVGPFVGKLFQLTFPVDGIEVVCSVPYTSEIDQGILVVRPAEGIHVRIERLCYISFLTRCQRIDTQSVTVGFIAVASHTLPSDILTVGRELRVLVVARIVLQVLRCIHSLMAQGL